MNIKKSDMDKDESEKGIFTQRNSLIKLVCKKGKGEKIKNRLKRTEHYQFLINSMTNGLFQKMIGKNGIRFFLKENKKFLREK